MKRLIKNLCIALTFMISVSSYGQDIISANGDTLASVSPGRIITNKSHQSVGEISVNGEIKDAQGGLMGTITGNVLKDASGAVVAKMNSLNANQTQLLDANDLVLGTVHFGLTITGKNGETLLNASEPIDKKLLAAYYFFFTNKSGN